MCSINSSVQLHVFRIAFSYVLDFSFATCRSNKLSYSKWTIKGNSLCARQVFQLKWFPQHLFTIIISCKQKLLENQNIAVSINMCALNGVFQLNFKWEKGILSSWIVITYFLWLFIEEYFASVWAQLKSWTITLISLVVGLICAASQSKWVKVFYWRSSIPSTAYRWGLLT